jgi:2,6-dihydroxypyridine 3-monooxygenase
MTSPPARALVIGGSLGGLTAALVLRDLGWEVDVLERSARPLEGRGAGIVLHPLTVRYLTGRAGADLRTVSAPARWLRYLGRDGSVLDEQPCRYRFTSYFTLHRGLLRCFDADRYHLGAEVVGLEQGHGRVAVTVRGGRTRTCDLLVCADGVHSTARRLLVPAVAPGYAGYVGWRGTVGEAELSPGSFAVLHEAITYHLLEPGHVLAYPIPAADGSLEAGRRLVNWVWYRNVPGQRLGDLLTDGEGRRHPLSLPPGGVREEHLRELRDAALRMLPPALAEVVARTAEPFVQAVIDLEVPSMAFGRACLIGDAAFALRPHAAAGTAKAAADAWGLAEALKERGGDVVAALQRWEPGRLALGRDVLARTRAAGERLQVTGTWRVGEPLPFGLHRTGDSSFPTRP